MRFPFLNDEVRDGSKVKDRFLSYGLNWVKKVDSK